MGVADHSDFVFQLNVHRLHQSAGVELLGHMYTGTYGKSNGHRIKIAHFNRHLMMPKVMRTKYDRLMRGRSMYLPRYLKH